MLLSVYEYTHVTDFLFYVYPFILGGTALSPNGEIRQNDLNKRAPLLLQSQGMRVHGLSLRGPALHGLEAFLNSTMYQRLFSSTPNINLSGEFIRDSQEMLLATFEWLKEI